MRARGSGLPLNRGGGGGARVPYVPPAKITLKKNSSKQQIMSNEYNYLSLRLVFVLKPGTPPKS